MSIDPNRVIWKLVINEGLRESFKRMLAEIAKAQYMELIHQTLQDRGLCECDLEEGQQPKTPVCDDCGKEVTPFTSVLAPNCLKCIACMAKQQDGG